MTKDNKTIQTPLAKAKGLGSAHEGVHHWLVHKVTTLMNIPLVAWLLYTVFHLKEASYAEFTTYMAQPFHSIAAILFVMVTLYHMALELQVVYEDYISCRVLRMIKIWGMKVFFLVLGLATIFMILSLGVTVTG